MLPIKQLMQSIINVFKRHPLAALLILAALARLVYIAGFADSWRFYDTIHYDTAGRSIAQGQGFGPSLHYGYRYGAYCLEPIYPLFIGGLYFLFGPSALSVRLAQVVLALLQIYLLFDIARRFFSSRAAFAAALFAAVYPFYIIVAGLVYPTQLYSLLLLALVWKLLVFIKHGRLADLICSAICYGLAVQTGPAILPSAPFVLWWLWHYRPRNQQPVFVFIGVFIITMLPWTLRNYFVFHTFSPGRACLEEKRFINNFYYDLVYQRAVEQDTFSADKVAIHFRQTADTLWIDGYVDGLRFESLRPLEQSITVQSPHYLGVLFEGDVPNHLQAVKASLRYPGAASPELVFASSDSLPYVHTPSVSTNGKAIIYEQALHNRWNNKLIWTDPLIANYFEMQLPDSIKPDALRKVALLVFMDTPELSANGYMVWLHPCLELDLWKVQNGKPSHSIPVEKRYWQREKLDITTVIWREPKAFFLDHYIPEFINFWSPIVKRIETAGLQPSPAMQLISLIFFLPLLLLLVPAVIRHRRRLEVVTITLLPVLTIAFSYALFSTEVRYRIPIDSFLILWAAAGLDAFLPRSFLAGTKNTRSRTRDGGHHG